MNILKIGLILFTSAGIGFGAERISNTVSGDNYNSLYHQNYLHMGYEEHCGNDEDFLSHMLEDLSEEDLIIVNAKIDELLLTYDTTLEELFNNAEVRYDFMADLMDFLETNEIDYHNHYEDGNGFYGMGGMH